MNIIYSMFNDYSYEVIDLSDDLEEVDIIYDYDLDFLSDDNQEEF